MPASAWAPRALADEGSREVLEQAVLEAFAAQPRVRVIVNLFDVDAQDEAREPLIAAARERALAELPSSELELIHAFARVPGFSAWLTAAGFRALRARAEVSSIQLDEPTHATLLESATLLRAAAARTTHSVTGQGVTVAIIDTGVDLNHPDVGPAVVAQRCFLSGGGCTSSANAQDRNGHGTHVAGIVTSDGRSAPLGVAPGASLVGVRVLDAGGSGANSDWVAALDWILRNRSTLGVRLVNMSLGTNTLYSYACDSSQAAASSAITQLRQAGITVFAAAGNDGSTSSVSSPACVTGTVVVGAVYDDALGREPDNGYYGSAGCYDALTGPQRVTCFSNSSTMVDVLAPGARTDSARLGGGSVEMSGTSMATPAAVGVAALLLQRTPSLTPSSLEAVLKSTGTPRTDPKSGRSTPSVDALSALNAVAACAGLGNGAACNDGDPCTVQDTCQGGLCVAGPPRACTGGSACIEAYCDAQSGQCLTRSRPNGASCSDGNACTVTDACQNGVCGGAPRVCAGATDCRDADLCDPALGCVAQPKANGLACDDGNACTLTDACQNGACLGTAKVCPGPTACLQAAVCDRSTGQCQASPKPNGAYCSDGNLCTEYDACRNGTCLGSPKVCARESACRFAATCDPTSGACLAAPKPNGGACSDGDLCTLTDSCEDGRCVGRTPKVCPGETACTQRGVCDSYTGSCVVSPKRDGTLCSDGNACTRSDVCRSGRCSGENPVVCGGATACRGPQACNTSTGACEVGPPVPDGNVCGDRATCSAGSCVAVRPAVDSTLGSAPQGCSATGLFPVPLALLAYLMVRRTGRR